MTPSESSVIRHVAMEPVFLDHLKSVLSIRGVKRVAMHEPLTSLYAVIAIQFARGTPETEIWRALHGASALHRFAGKWIIAVDEDIDPENADALFWAMSYRCQPQHDLRVVAAQGSRPRAARSARRRRERGGADQRHAEGHVRAGRVAQARIHGERQGDLGAARPAAAQAGKPPWHGYDLGHWPEELERQAQMAVESDYFALGREPEQRATK